MAPPEPAPLPKGAIGIVAVISILLFLNARITGLAGDLLVVDSTGTSLSEPGWKDLPTRSYNVQGFCSRVPMDTTAGMIWNALRADVLRMTPVDDAEDLQGLVDRLLSPYNLRNTQRGRPLFSTWGAFLDKVNARIRSSRERSVRIAVLVTKDEPSGWPRRLQGLLDRALGPRVVVVDIHSVPYPSSELFTKGLTYNLLYKSDVVPDMIIHSLFSSDDYAPDRDHNVLEDVTFMDHRRFVAEDWLRAAMESQPCHDSPPVVMFVDDTLPGHNHGGYLADSIQARVVQQLVDHYQVPFVSFVDAVRRTILTDESSVFYYGKDPSVDGQIGVLWSILFSFLSYTVEYCDHVANQASEQYQFSSFDSAMRHRVEHIVPPYLSGNLSLSDVSEKWQQEEERQTMRREHVCLPGRQVKSRKCIISSLGPGRETSVGLQSHLSRYIKRQRGWRIVNGGILEASSPGASLELAVPLKRSEHVDEVTLFTVREDSTRQATSPQLQVDVRAGPVHERISIIPSHNSAVSVALPDVVNLREPVGNTTMSIKLELVQGDHVRVAGLFACDSVER